MKLSNLLVFIFSILLSVISQAQIDSSRVVITRFDKVNTNARINNIYIDNKNVIWLASSDGLIETTGDGSKYNVHFENTEMVDVTPGRRDDIWVASQNAIYNFKTKLAYSLPDDGIRIKNITHLEGSLWIGTDNGLYEFSTGSGKFKVYDSENSKLANNKINFVHADKNKIVWVGTDAGYVRIDGNKWELQDKKLQMLATCENDEGQWIISSKDMFLISKFNRLFPVKLDESQYQGKINQFIIDSKGRVYIASDILARYNPYNEEINNYAEDAATLSRAAISLGVDRNDNIWIGTDGAGFYKLLFGDVVAEQVNGILIVENNISCPGSKDGRLKLSVSGGTTPYKYQWNVPGTSGTVLNAIGAGSYEVTVTDKTGSTSVASITLDNPKPVSIELIENNRVSNPDKPDGSILVRVHGGAGGYSFNWSNGQTSQNLTGARPGPYTLNVRDKNGCDATATFHIKRERFIPDLDISKIELGQKLRINDLNFPSDSSSISYDNYDILDEVYEFLISNPSVNVEIGGHTNTIPPHEYCDKLSTDRARNVAQYLYDRGIPENRVTFKGYGKREPLTESISAQGRQRNQRVEILITAL